MTKIESTSITALPRNLADLLDLRTRKMEGPSLIELRADPMNLRIKRVYLTNAVQKFVSRLIAADAQAHTASLKRQKKPKA